MWKWISGVGVLLLVIGCQGAPPSDSPCGPNSCPMNQMQPLQCPGGSCPVNPPSIDINDLPALGGAYGPVQQEGYLRSAVRIAVTLQEGGMAKGSGVYVVSNDTYVVITAAHVVRGSTKVFVTFRGSKNPITVQAEVLYKDTTYDCAILGLYRHPLDGEDIATTMAYQDDLSNLESQSLQNAGFGGDEVLNAGIGRILKYMAPSGGLANDWMVIRAKARFGDSGGPVYLSSGKVAGILWGKDNSTIVCVAPGRVHICLNKGLSAIGVDQAQLVQPRPIPRQPKKLVPVMPMKPPVLPWRDKIENELDGIKRAPPKCNPAPPPVIRPAPPKVDVDVDVNKPVTPPVIKEDERYRVEAQLALYIIAGVVLVCLVVGIGVQWKKTYSIQ